MILNVKINEENAVLRTIAVKVVPENVETLMATEDRILGFILSLHTVEVTRTPNRVEVTMRPLYAKGKVVASSYINHDDSSKSLIDYLVFTVIEDVHTGELVKPHIAVMSEKSFQTLYTLEAVTVEYAGDCAGECEGCHCGGCTRCTDNEAIDKDCNPEDAPIAEPTCPEDAHTDCCCECECCGEPVDEEDATNTPEC